MTHSSRHVPSRPPRPRCPTGPARRTRPTPRRWLSPAAGSRAGRSPHATRGPGTRLYPRLACVSRSAVSTPSRRPGRARDVPVQQHISPALRSAAGNYDRRAVRTVTTDWFTVPRGELPGAAEVSLGPILADRPGCEMGALTNRRHPLPIKRQPEVRWRTCRPRLEPERHSPARWVRRSRPGRGRPFRR
jgi:hypothetical protein